MKNWCCVELNLELYWISTRGKYYDCPLIDGRILNFSAQRQEVELGHLIIMTLNH